MTFKQPKTHVFSDSEQPRVEELESRTLMTATPAAPPVALALIDQTLPDQALIAQSTAGVTRVYFDPRRESAAAVLNAAIRASDGLGQKINDLMVFSHGDAGNLSLGDQLLSGNNLQGTTAQWQKLSRYFARGASIDLFACDLASSPLGKQLLNKVHKLTGANVYGSTNLTGRGGDWTLEARSENAPSQPTVSADTQMLASYPADLLISTITAAAASPSTVTGTSTVLSVTMLDTLGTPTFNWATTSKPAGSTVTFSNNNTSTASISTATFNKAGNYSFTVTATDGAASNSSSVNVTVNQTLTSITVTPGTATVSLNATQSFSASALDQFGNTMSSQPSFTWARTGVGSINASGLFSSASVIGSSIVSATSGLISGTATVTVANATPTIATAAAASSGTVTGNSVALSVLGADDGGESNLTYTWAATTKPAGSTPTFSSNGLNSSKAATVTFYTAGSYTFQATVTDAYGASVTSSVNVSVSQTLSSITVAPAAPTLHLNQTQTFTDTGFDQFGNAMGVAPTVTWSLAGASVGSIGSTTGSYSSGATPGTATVDAVASGITGADTVTVSNAVPTIATAAAATPSTTTGTTSVLSVLGADDGGESNLTYTWSATTKPLGAASPTYSVNGTNAAKNSTVTFSQTGTYILQVTVADAFGASTTSSVAVTVNQGNPNLTVTSGNTALNLNQSQLFTATAYDQFGNPLAVQPTFTWSLGTGSVGTIGALTGIYNSGSVPGSATVIATSGSFASSEAVTVTNAAPTVATAAACTPGTVTGTTGQLSVLGADDGGESNLTYTWSTTTKPAGAAPTFSINGTNAAKNSTVTFNAAGNYVFTATLSDGTLTTTSTVSVTVNQTRNSVTVSPNTAALNENGTKQFSAVAYDQFGTAMATQPAFTWSTVLGSVGSVNSTGLYTAPGLAGSATVAATTGLITGTASVTITNAAPTVAVPASASPSTVTGTTTALSVLGADDGGESNLSYTWSAITKPTGSTVFFSANIVNVAKNVTATFSAAGSYVLNVVISDGVNSVSSSVSVTVAQTATTIAVSPSVATLHENATQQFSAVAYDQFGAMLTTQPSFTWTKTSGVGSINSSGLFSSATSVGSAVVQASSGSASGSASVTVVNAAPTVATPAAASQTTVTGLTTTLTVLGADDGGEPNLTYTWSASIAPLGATASFSANGTNAAKSSIVTFNEPGAYALTATISDGSQTVTSTVAVTVVSTATTLTMTPSNISLAENATQIFAAVAYDQFGTALVLQPLLSWSKASGVGTVSALGTYTAPASPGSAVVSVTGAGLTTTAAVTVINTPPTIALAAAATPSTVTGTTTTLTVLGADDGGESNLTYTWAATTVPTGGAVTFSANATNAAKSSAATFNRAGNYTLTATVFDGTNSVTSAVAVTVSQTLTSIVVTPATASVHLNQSQQLTAQAFDQFGNLMSPQPTLLWTVLGGGSVTQSGLFTSAASAVSATVSASSGLVSGSAAISVTNAAPTVATPAAATPTSVSGLTTTLSVLGADDGGESNLTYTWSAASPAGATPVFSNNGAHSAKSTVVTFNALGSYTFTATITDAYGASVTSSVAVTVSQTLTSITIAPINKTLSIGQTNQFSASAWDQFGNAMSSSPAFTWSVASGGGTVDSTGLFTAPGSAGSSIITASSGAVSGSASVTTVNSLAITATVNPTTGTSASLGILGLSGLATLSWSVTSQPTGGSATFDTTTGSTPTLSFSAAGSYTVQLGVTIAGITTNLSDTFTVSQQLTSITVLPGSVTVHENQSTTLVAIASDQFGVPMLAQPTFTWTVFSGSGSVSSSGVYTSAGGAGNTVVRATSGSVFGNATVTTINAPPTISTPAAASPALVTGTTTALSVLGADDGGETSLQYTWTVTGSPIGSTVLFSTNGNNSAKNTTATFNRAGAYIFTVTVSDGTNSTTSVVTATVIQTATTVAITPASTSVNETGADLLVANTSDQFGNAMVLQPPVSWSETDGLGSVNSLGVFIAGTNTGTADVRATAGGVFADQSITITHGAPTVITPATALLDAATGTDASLNVLGSDENGESILAYTWTTISAPAGATVHFGINAINAAKSTTVTFNQAGSYTFQASISNGLSLATSTVTMVVQQVLSSINLTPASVSVNLQASQRFNANGLDQFGSAMLSVPAFTWSVNSGVGSIDASGLYSSGSVAGSADVRVSAGGVHVDAAVTVNNAAPTIVNPAAATPGLVSGVSTQLSVLANDDNGEANLTYTWAATAAPSGAAPAFSINDSNAAKNTTVYFDMAGSYTFSVTTSDGFNNVVSSVSVTVSQTLSSVQVVPPAASIPAGAVQQLSAIAGDQFGSPLAHQPSFNWTLPSGSGSVTPTGLYTAGSADGIAMVQAQIGGVTGGSALTVYGVPPQIVDAATPSSQIVTGTFTDLSVSASTTSMEPLTFSWSMTSGPAGITTLITPGTVQSASGVFTGPAHVIFNAPGDYTFAATISDGVESIISSVSVTVESTLTTIGVTGGSAPIDVNGTQQMSLAGLDQFGVGISTPAVSWSVTNGGGTISSEGIFQAASSAGDSTVSAAAGGVIGTAVVQVQQYLPTVATAAYADSTTVTGSTTALHVRGAEWITGDAGLTYTWNQVSGPGTTQFSVNGSHAAGDTIATFNSAGTYLLQATISDVSGLSVTSSVAVGVKQTLSGLTVTVPQSTSTGGGTEQLAAHPTDQFGAVMAWPVVWSVDPGSVGSIDSNGVFTVGNVNGVSTVRATAGSFTASASITSVAKMLNVGASFSQPYTQSGVGVLQAVFTGDSTSNVIYDWQIVSQPKVKTAKSRSGVAVAAPPQAFFGTNNTASSSTPVTFTATGAYVFEVTATDGSLSTSRQIAVNVTKAASTKAVSVAGVQPTISNGFVTGYTVFFNQAMNAATVTNANAYAISQIVQVPKTSTVLNKVLKTAPKLITLNYKRTIATVTYNPGNFSSTIVLAEPEPLSTGSWTIQLKGTGAYAIRNAAGQRLNASKLNGAGSTFSYSATVQVGTFTHNFGGGVIGTLALTGPGTLAVVTLGNLPPTVYLIDCDPATSRLTGTLAGKPKVVKPFELRGVIGDQTAVIKLGAAFTLDASV